MATLVVRNVPEATQRKLRCLAAAYDMSREQLIRKILSDYAEDAALFAFGAIDAPEAAKDAS